MSFFLSIFRHHREHDCGHLALWLAWLSVLLVGPGLSCVPRSPHTGRGSQIHRSEAKLDLTDLAYLPARAPVVASAHPDFLTALLPRLQMSKAFRYWFGKSAGSGLQKLIGVDPTRTRLSAALGLRRDRAMVFALYTSDPGRHERTWSAVRGLLRVQGSGPEQKTALLRIKPGLVRSRFVAQVASADGARAAVLKVANGLAGVYPRTTVVTQLAGKAPWKPLHTRGVFAVAYSLGGWAVAVSLVNNRLIVDLLEPLTGVWTAQQAVAELVGTVGAPVGGYKINGALARLTLGAGGDLNVYIQARFLALVAACMTMWSLRAVSNAKPAYLRALLAMNVVQTDYSLRFMRQAKSPFAGFGLSLSERPGWPELTLRWQLTSQGERLFKAPTDKVSGVNLSQGKKLETRWWIPLAAGAKRLFPASRGLFKNRHHYRNFIDTGLYQLPLALAEFWPRLLSDPEVFVGVPVLGHLHPAWTHRGQVKPSKIHVSLNRAILTLTLR